MNIETVKIHILVILIFIVKITGKIIAISISKIKKRTAIRKNWIENGDRADLFGSNPHSNGDLFSRSFFEVLEIVEHNIIMQIDRIIANDSDIIIIKIIFSLLKDLLIGSQLYLLY